MFSPLTSYDNVYGDTIKTKRDFETEQVLEGVVENTDGRESIVVMALNCKTGRIFQTYADKKGKFAINVNEFVDSTVFNVDAYDNMDKRKSYDLSLTEPGVPKIPAPQSVHIASGTTGYYDFDSARMLKNIEVIGRGKTPMNRFNIEPTKGYFDGDPAIYRHANISSLLRSMGVYRLGGATVLLDNLIIQRSTDTGDDYTFDPDIEGYLNSININEVWQVEYIKNDPRTMMFQSFQKGNPVLLIYTKLGVGGRRALGRPLANSFTPKGYEPNVPYVPEKESDLILWMPEYIVKKGEKLDLDIDDDDLIHGVNVYVTGITEQGELVDSKFFIK